MNIVVLDRQALFSNDIPSDCFDRYGSVRSYDRTPPELAAERIGSAEIVFTNKTPVSRKVLDQCPNVRYIGLFSTGYNIIDLHACKERGIIVSNVPSYSTGAVAQQVFAFLLHFCNRVAEYNEAVQQGAWVSSSDFCFYRGQLTELAGKTLGIVGYGSIGRAVASLAHAFGMHVLVSTRTLKRDTSVSFVPLEELLECSDFVTLHCPLTEQTRGLIDRNALSLMKPSAVLINTSRGPVVDEQALAEALSAGKLAGAGLDVLCTEPMSPDCPLLGLKNCVITPHIAWAAKETRERLLAVVLENFDAFLAGQPIHTVSL